MIASESKIFLGKYQSKIRGVERGTKSISIFIVLENGELQMKEIFFNSLGEMSESNHFEKLQIWII